MTRRHDIPAGPGHRAAPSTAPASLPSSAGVSPSDMARDSQPPIACDSPPSTARVCPPATTRVSPPTTARVSPPSSSGQASVELVALLPLVAVIVLAAVTVLASHVAHEQAGEAAEAGALAVLQGGEPKAAAERALSEAARRRATITVADGRVHVRVRPRVALPVPGLAERLAGEARAEARP